LIVASGPSPCFEEHLNDACGRHAVAAALAKNVISLCGSDQSKSREPTGNREGTPPIDKQ